MTNSTITSLGNYQFKSNYLNNAVVQNGIAYLAAGEQGLFLIDVKNPSTPKLLKQLDISGYVYDVVIVGKTAFLASENEGLKIVDVSTPTQAKILTTFTDSIVNLQSIAVANNVAYLADWENGLLIVDVSNVTAPNLLATLPISYAKNVVLTSGNSLALILSDAAELTLVDVTTANAPIKLSTLHLGNDAREIAVIDNNTLAVAAGDEGIKIVSIANTSAPKIIATLSINSPHNLVSAVSVIDNKTLAVTNGAKGIVIVDVSNTTAPKITNTIPTTSATTELVLDNGLLYSLNHSVEQQGLQIFKTSSTTSSQTPNLNSDKIPYVLSVDKTSVFEGGSVVITLTAKNATKDTIVPFTFSGKVSSDDVIGGLPASSFTIADNNTATLSLTFTEDNLKEAESLTLTLKDDSKQKVTISVKDKAITATQISANNPNFRGEGEKADEVNGSEKKDSVWGGSGNDTLKGNAGNDTIDGYNGDDKLFGEADNDSLIGGNGNDLLNGGEGDDTLKGDAGNDSLDGGEGGDNLDGGEGDDYYVVDNIEDSIIEDTSNKGGNDTVEIHVQVPSFVGVENYIIKNEGNIDVSGDNNPNKIVGDIGNNYLRGNGGNDTLIGNAGDDTLEGGEGIDQLDGGLGDDIYIIDNDEDQIIDTQGENRVQSSKTISIATYDAITNLELIGNAAINGTGNDKNNILEGNENNNRLDGRKGNDTVNGFGGDDTLIGGSGGNDLLDGGNGEDTVIYEKPQSDYNATFIDGVYVVTHINSGNKDEFKNIEYVKYSDTQQPILIQNSTQKTLTLSVSDVIVKEGNEAILTLKLNEQPSESVTIKVQTVDSTANKNIDYDNFSKSVVFAPTQIIQTVKIKTKQNTLVEDDKKFMLNLSTADENVEISTPTAFVTIEDDDKPKLSIASAKIIEGQTGKSLVDITVSLSAPTKQLVKVRYETSDSTAKKSTDYEPTAGELEIPAGKKTAKISVPIVDDNLQEQTESFFVTLSNAKNATLNATKSVATVEITDNDNSSSLAMQIDLVGIHTEKGGLL